MFLVLEGKGGGGVETDLPTRPFIDNVFVRACSSDWGQTEGEGGKKKRYSLKTMIIEFTLSFVPVQLVPDRLHGKKRGKKEGGKKRTLTDTSERRTPGFLREKALLLLDLKRPHRRAPGGAEPAQKKKGGGEEKTI